ncbi:MarR family winged helix-turn-helix transcriptional regulator [Leuconostoc carnosum]|uniref:MarR family winged helix-turn-helix transcriptional regulator n=1 Tax=Leuconostoc carnosum TaxID=1252 RepID=UPI001CC24B6B|nr:ArsR family transcriptional regulator [Leuconostoc carnosum]
MAERNLVNPEEVTWLQYDILSLLQIRSYLPKELSKHLSISRSKLSKSLVGLHNLGYISQSPAQLDRREMITDLTDKGRTFLVKTDEKHNELLVDAEASLTNNEQQLFIQLAEKFVSELRERRLNNETK